jgi:hypothetical protein
MAGWTFSHLGEKIWRVLYQLANVLSRETRPDCPTWIVQSWEPEMDIKSLCIGPRGYNSDVRTREHEMGTEPFRVVLPEYTFLVRNMRNAAVYVRLVKPWGFSCEDTY